MVYIFLADGFEEIEALTVVDLLRRASIDISMVSITGKREVIGSHQIRVASDLLYEETDYNDAQMLVLPGGLPGSDNLQAHNGLDGLLREFDQKGKPLAAICAAPRILGQKGLLKDKMATCYPGNESKLIGAKYMDMDVVVDGNVITSKGMGTAIDFSLELISKLKSKAEADRIAAAIQYRH